MDRLLRPENTLASIFHDEVSFHRNGLMVGVSPPPKNLAAVLNTFDARKMQTAHRQAVLQDYNAHPEEYLFKIMVREERIFATKDDYSDSIVLDVLLWKKNSFLTGPFMRFVIGEHDSMDIKSTAGALKFFTLIKTIVKENKDAYYTINLSVDDEDFENWIDEFMDYLTTLGASRKHITKGDSNYLKYVSLSKLQPVTTNPVVINGYETALKELFENEGFLTRGVIIIDIDPFYPELIPIYDEFDPERMNMPSKTKIKTIAMNNPEKYLFRLVLLNREVKVNGKRPYKIMLDLCLWQRTRDNKLPTPFLSFECGTYNDISEDAATKFLETIKSIAKCNVNTTYTITGLSTSRYENFTYAWTKNLKNYMEMMGLRQNIIIQRDVIY